MVGERALAFGNAVTSDAVLSLPLIIHAEVGQIDILVNNAGIIKRIPSCAQVQTRSDRLICTIFVNERLTPVGRFFSFVW